ncbi:uncharacterized protein N7477_005937 [Penicillium maclennaniae]|uniref:uncharacterized protein n=1 Tax=Penicillium maclennaniae TaxID=1343394 RepID=UPI002541B7DF|nr:uncharacterized protein N7477_005937 [Penicillium maclennaniae]KAJ5670574.1 hypothetical protein N7477_005937 [Penicillium maclennaniae]
MLLPDRVFQLLLVLLTLSTLCTQTSAATANSTLATTTTTAWTPTATGTATHTIQVGPKSSPHQYVPHSITANVGDIVIFEFYPANHSVVKADFDAPCVPASGPVFWSGMFNSFNEEDGQLVGPPTFFYCTAIGSCLENGMVGVINPNATRTFEEQYKRALVYPYMLVPGQSMPAEGSEGGASSTTSTTSSGITTSAAATGGGSHGLSTGALAGIVIASVAFVAILVALFFVLGRQRVYSQWMSSQDGRTERTARWAMFGHGHGHGHGNPAPSEPYSRKSELDVPMATPMDTVSTKSPDPNRNTFSSGPDGSSGHLDRREAHFFNLRERST